MMPAMSRNARLLPMFALLSAMLSAGVSLAAHAGPMALHAIVDDSPYDGGSAGDPEADSQGPVQIQPDDPDSSEDGTDGQPGAAAPEAPSGCTFRDEPLELVV